jgi:Ca2+-binding RTX toxin-like protein
VTRIARIALTMSLLVPVLSLAAPAQAAVEGFTTISSSGPLTEIDIGVTLGCQVEHEGDEPNREFFPSQTRPGSCGTFLFVEGAGPPPLFGPDFTSRGSATGFDSSNETPFTKVSQSAVTGNGTRASPFKVRTVVDAGATGLRITEDDSYVTGDEAYQTGVKIQNNSGSPRSVILYRAGDCFLAGSDEGFGIKDSATGGVGCQAVDPGTGDPGDRIEEWVPITGDSHFMEAFFSSIWNRIKQHLAFPDTCEHCTPPPNDNGAGLSWSATIPAGLSITRSHLTTFSPTGKLSLATSKNADSGQTPAGGSNGYTIQVDNPNTENVILNSISDDLPAGFTFVTGSSSLNGNAIGDPTISGQHLTWNGPFNDPGGDSVSLHFNVVVSSTPGTYFNNATADAGSFSVAPSGDTAPITVTPGLCQPSSPPGTGTSDRLVGTSGPDKIAGGDGRDYIDGLAGNDELCGENGGDFVYGRDGQDKIDGGAQNDRLFGGRGADVITGGSGHDAIFARSGSDTINANDGEVDCIIKQAGDTMHKDGFDLVNPPAGDPDEGCPAGFWL